MNEKKGMNICILLALLAIIVGLYFILDARREHLRMRNNDYPSAQGCYNYCSAQNQACMFEGDFSGSCAKQYETCLRTCDAQLCGNSLYN